MLAIQEAFDHQWCVRMTSSSILKSLIRLPQFDKSAPFLLDGKIKPSVKSWTRLPSLSSPVPPVSVGFESTFDNLGVFVGDSTLPVAENAILDMRPFGVEWLWNVSCWGSS